MACRWAWVVGCLLALGCAHTKAAGDAGGRKYVDEDSGFELTRPTGDWLVDTTERNTLNGVSVPLVMRERQTGAQVMLQVAPAVATPTQFAQRINAGLQEHPGFLAGDIEPLPLSNDAVGFHFEAGGELEGRVAIVPGTSGRVLMLLGTWPKANMQASSAIDAVFASLRPVPRG